MANRVFEIREKKDISWKHVPTDQNSSDQGSRGAIADKLEDLWFKGPEWLKKSFGMARKHCPEAIKRKQRRCKTHQRGVDENHGETQGR